MPEDLRAGATVSQPVMDGFLTSVNEIGLSAGWAQRFFEYDAATLGDPPDPATPPDSAELALAREVVALLPPAVQKHIRMRRHLERREFVSTVARMGAPIGRRPSAERNEIRQRIARRLYTKQA